MENKYKKLRETLYGGETTNEVYTSANTTLIHINKVCGGYDKLVKYDYIIAPCDSELSEYVIQLKNIGLGDKLIFFDGVKVEKQDWEPYKNSKVLVLTNPPFKRKQLLPILKKITIYGFDYCLMCSYYTLFNKWAQPYIKWASKILSINDWKNTNKRIGIVFISNKVFNNIKPNSTKWLNVPVKSVYSLISDYNNHKGKCKVLKCEVKGKNKFCVVVNNNVWENRYEYLKKYYKCETKDIVIKHCFNI